MTDSPKATARKPWKELSDEERADLIEHNAFFQGWCPDKGELKTMNSCGWGFGFDVPNDRIKDVEAFASVAIDREMARRERFRRDTWQSFEAPSVILIAERDMVKKCLKRKGIRMKFKKDTLRVIFTDGTKASTYSYDLVK